MDDHIDYPLGKNLNFTRRCLKRMILRIFDLLLKGHIGLFELNPMDAVFFEFVIVFDMFLVLRIEIEENLQPFFFSIGIKIFNPQSLCQVGDNIKIRLAFSQWFHGAIDKRVVRSRGPGTGQVASFGCTGYRQEQVGIFGLWRS